MEAMMMLMLDDPPEVERLKGAASGHTMSVSSRRYLDVLLGCKGTSH